MTDDTYQLHATASWFAESAVQALLGGKLQPTHGKESHNPIPFILLVLHWRAPVQEVGMGLGPDGHSLAPPSLLS